MKRIKKLSLLYVLFELFSIACLVLLPACGDKEDPPKTVVQQPANGSGFPSNDFGNNNGVPVDGGSGDQLIIGDSIPFSGDQACQMAQQILVLPNPRDCKATLVHLGNQPAFGVDISFGSPQDCPAGCFYEEDSAFVTANGEVIAYSGNFDSQNRQFLSHMANNYPDLAGQYDLRSQTLIQYLEVPGQRRLVPRYSLPNIMTGYLQMNSPLWEITLGE